MLRTVVVTVAIALVGCKQQSSKLEPAAGPSAPQPAAPSSPHAPSGEHAIDESAIAGTVVETMNASEYTYARLDHDGTSIWVAGPQTALAVGTKVGPISGTAMPGFHSDTLNRTFDQIYFVASYGASGAAAATPPAAPAGELRGVITETMNAGGYTYAHLDRDGTQLWVAGPETKLVVGSKLGVMTGTLMEKFHSDTLKRTFDQIYFVSSYVVASGAIANPHSGSAAQPAPAAPIEKIKPAANGKTIAEVFANKDALSGKPVIVRGKITKVTNGVLNRNWLHIQDGTGSAGTNDLLITTQATAKVGDVVTVNGTVATNQDFGAGYKYAVLVEGTVSP